MLLLFAWYFSGILTVEAAVPFTLLPALGTHFLLVDCLVQSKLSVRACLIVFFFILEVCSFLKEDGGGVDPGVSWRGNRWEERREENCD